MTSPPAQGAGRPAAVPPATGRLCSIDVARAVAIVMMLQGHFVALTLAPEFRDLANPAFLAHARLRGLTAPLFLTVSGLVFVYFVRGGSGLGLDNPRVRRGLRRGLSLLLIGYALRLDLLALLAPEGGLFARLWGTHVLHVVGAGLWLLSLAWVLTDRVGTWALGTGLALLGMLFFATTGLVRAADLSGVPGPLLSYLVPAHGGQFALFPWLGYVCFGGACGATLGSVRLSRRWLAPASWLLLAALLHQLATPWVFRLYRACEGRALCAGLPDSHNYLHPLAAVLSLLALLVLAEPLLRRCTPDWLTSTGQHTLLIFVVHAVVLYGGLTGWGMASLVRGAFTPLQAAAGAVAFVALHVLLVQLWVRRPAQPGLPSVARYTRSRLSSAGTPSRSGNP